MLSKRPRMRRRSGNQHGRNALCPAVGGAPAVIDDQIEDVRPLEDSRSMTLVPGALDAHHYQRLVHSVIDYAIFMLSPEGVVTSWNLGAERIKGYEAEEILGKHFSVFYSAEDR